MEEKEVAKHMGDDFVTKLSQLLSVIDECKFSLLSNPENIVYLNERIHAWYVKILGKMMAEKMDDEITKQKEFQRKLAQTPAVKEVIIERCGSKRTQLCLTTLYQKHKEILEEREAHLNFCMEKLGLTNPQKKEKKRFS